MALAQPRLMLDSNAVIALLKGLSPSLDALVREQRCCLSSIVVAEIRYGLEKLSPGARMRSLAEEAMEAIEVLLWSEGCARVYGRLRADLERNGRTLSAMDLLIASHALTEGCSLVTADQVFAQVGELSLEAW